MEDSSPTPLSLLRQRENPCTRPSTPVKSTPSLKRKAFELDTTEEYDTQASEQRRDAKQVAIIPNGDVILKAGRGTDAVDFKVSGTVISLASPVFSAMLSSPTWQEHSSKEIELYDEDPNTVFEFCNLVHLKWDKVHFLFLGELLKLALFADMRCCTTVVKPWVESKCAAFIACLEYNQLIHKDGEQVLDGVCELGWLHEAHSDEHMMQLAAILGLDTLLWHATRYYFYEGFDDLELPADTHPALVSHHESSKDFHLFSKHTITTDESN